MCLGVLEAFTKIAATNLRRCSSVVATFAKEARMECNAVSVR